MTIDTALVQHTGELLFRKRQLLPCIQPLPLSEPLFDHLLLAGLDGKIRHRKSDLILARIAILGDEIAGVARQHDIQHFLAGALRHWYRFRDVSKMI